MGSSLFCSVANGDEVLPWRPLRRWVLTVPHRLRYQMAWDHGLARRPSATRPRTEGPTTRPARETSPPADPPRLSPRRCCLTLPLRLARMAVSSGARKARGEIFVCAVTSASAEENVRVRGGVLGHHTPFMRTVLNLPSVLAIRKDTASVGFPSAAISAKEGMIPVS